MIRKDIDEIIADAFTYKSFLELLHRRGYKIKSGPNIKHTAVCPPGGARYIRLDSLGDGYTEEEIKARLAESRQEPLPRKPTPPVTARPVYRYRGNFVIYKPRKLHGFRALYFKYLYLLRAVRKTPARSKTPFPLKEELLKFDRYQRQFRFLAAYRIDTGAELSMLSDAIQAEADVLTDRRRELYRRHRRGDDTVTDEIGRLTARLRELRREQRMCGAIRADIPKILQAVHRRPRRIERRGESTADRVLCLRPPDL